jgi:hypothetical protein
MPRDRVASGSSFKAERAERRVMMWKSQAIPHHHLSAAAYWCRPPIPDISKLPLCAAYDTGRLDESYKGKALSATVSLRTPNVRQR